MYVKVKNQAVEKFPYSINNFRRDHKNISFPSLISDEILRQYGVYKVIEVDQPSHDHATQYIREANPEFINGTWTQKWEIVERTADEIVAYQTSYADTQRITRNRLLEQSDFSQLPDAPVNAAVWATYRQALRDVPSQEGFPWNVTWPSKPE